MENHCLDCGKILSAKHCVRCMACHNKHKLKIKPKKYCVDCKKEIRFKSTRCSKCSNEYSHKNRKINKCIDCEKTIKYSSKRCKSCSQKGVFSSNFGKRYAKKYHCFDCGKELGWKSKRCKDCYQTWKSISINNPNYKNAKPKCLDCGKTIDYKNKRCWNCNKLYKKQLDIDYGNRYGKNNSNYKGGKPKCIDCGKDLCDYKRTIKYCRSCYNKHCVGNGNHNWKGGVSFLPYSPKWTPILKLKIRTRDNFICKKCNMSDITHFKKYNRSLTVHHMDYNKQNCKESNLITLCVKCNSKANKHRDYWFAYYTYIMENNILKGAK
ncbi:MAG: hypothetical protein M0R03_12480 [Novosphingobium sp.]|nr:hypothetical protein [Novosphingobium sp.]